MEASSSGWRQMVAQVPVMTAGGGTQLVAQPCLLAHVFPKISWTSGVVDMFDQFLDVEIAKERRQAQPAALSAGTSIYIKQEVMDAGYNDETPTLKDAAITYKWKKKNYYKSETCSQSKIKHEASSATDNGMPQLSEQADIKPSFSTNGCVSEDHAIVNFKGRSCKRESFTLNVPERSCRKGNAKSDTKPKSCTEPESKKPKMGRTAANSTKLPPYRCDTCDKAFYCEHNLIAHKKEASLPLACRKCCKVFSWKRNLANHKCKGQAKVT